MFFITLKVDFAVLYWDWLAINEYLVIHPWSIFDIYVVTCFGNFIADLVFNILIVLSYLHLFFYHFFPIHNKCLTTLFHFRGWELINHVMFRIANVIKSLNYL